MTEKAETRPVRVLLVEDHPDFRDLMEALFSMDPDIKLVAQAGSLAEAHDYAAKFELDVVVLDLGLPDGNGIHLIPDLRRANPKVRVLILSASLDAASYKDTTEAGVDEIMDKLAPVDEVLGTVKRLGSA